MRNFCEYYSHLPTEKKCAILLFCPCVTLYYIIYNLLKEFGNLLVFIVEKCLFPILNRISRCLSCILEECCYCVDVFLKAILQVLTKFCELIFNILERVLSIFKPLFNCLSNILNFIVQNFCLCLQKIYSCIEAGCIFICSGLENCLNKIYDCFCRKICDCLKTCLFQIYDGTFRYIIMPIARVIKNIFSFSGILSVGT